MIYPLEEISPMDSFFDIKGVNILCDTIHVAVILEWNYISAVNIRNIKKRHLSKQL